MGATETNGRGAETGDERRPAASAWRAWDGWAAGDGRAGTAVGEGREYASEQPRSWGGERTHFFLIKSGKWIIFYLKNQKKVKENLLLDLY